MGLGTQLWSELLYWVFLCSTFECQTCMNKQTPDILVLFLLVVVRGYPFWRVFRMLSWLTPTWQHHGPHREKYRPTGSSFNRYGCLNSACVHGLAIVEKKAIVSSGSAAEASLWGPRLECRHVQAAPCLPAPGWSSRVPDGVGMGRKNVCWGLEPAYTLGVEPFHVSSVLDKPQ